MKEKPILFSGPMVRAILDGRKNQTRRVVKIPPHIAHGELSLTRMQDSYPDGTRPIWGDDYEPNLFSTRNRFGRMGDWLWVRETWNVVPVGRPAPLCGTDGIPKSLPDGWGVMYQASGDCCTKLVGWRPSIHMPRWASRITLEITGVRVERLQEISEADAIAEGIEEIRNLPSVRGSTKSKCWRDYGIGVGFYQPAQSYRSLWESNNGPGSWDANPWVWVIEFRRVEK